MLALWCPDLPFQLARQREATLAGRPLAFRDPTSRRMPTLWMVDRLAKAAGLSAGLSLDLALHRDPGLVVLDPVPSTWMEARAFLSQHLLTFSPSGRLGRFGEGFLDLRGTERLHGPALDAAERVRRDLRAKAGWSAHGGLSRSFTASRLAAKAEDLIRVVDDGAERAFLAPQGLKVLPALDARARERLHAFGLSKVAHLQPMAVADLGRVIPAPTAYQVILQATGADQERLPDLEAIPSSETVFRILNPPQAKHDAGVGPWIYRTVWGWRLDGRHLRQVSFSWRDEDEVPHAFRMAFDASDLRSFSQGIEARFLREATRRVRIQRVDLEAWLGAAPAAAPLLMEATTAKRLRLEAVQMKVQQRFGGSVLHLGVSP
ncbi:MAG: hypothetical protein JSR64_15865 [Nitrospira sp.]|nr:hypothetical protein [Nitrospira sp.]